MCDHLNKSYLAVPSWGLFVVQYFAKRNLELSSSLNLDYSKWYLQSLFFSLDSRSVLPLDDVTRWNSKPNNEAMLELKEKSRPYGKSSFVFFFQLGILRDIY